MLFNTVSYITFKLKLRTDQNVSFLKPGGNCKTWKNIMKQLMATLSNKQLLFRDCYLDYI